MLTLGLQQATAQDISGHVFEWTDGKKHIAKGAFVHCINETSGVVTDSVGHFTIKPCAGVQKLVVEYVGTKADTIILKKGITQYEMDLFPDGEILDAAIAKGRKQRYGISSLDPKTTINLDEREFQKAACCNLSESFENAPAIDVSFGDAVTGTRQIKMLGLDGFYSMISREFMPSVRLLNSYYGMSFIPAAWVNGIQITKGAGSVVNGYESIAGQINIELKKPFGGEAIMYDQFFSESGRTETDLMYRKDISTKLATSLFVRGSLYPVRMDRNNDGYLDNPTGNQFQAMNRWQFFTDSNLEGQVSVSYNNDSKNAGQLAYYEDALGTNLHYGIGIDNEQFDVWAKLGKVFPNKPYQSIGTQYGFSMSKINSEYGNSLNNRIYSASSKSFYTNLMFQSILGSTVHGYKVGVSFIADDLDETISINTSISNYSNYSRTEVVPGAFAEYTYQPNEKMSIVAGVRSDYNNLYGLSVTPRLHSKFYLNKERTTLRVSAGSGRRTSNIFGQNQQLFASARDIQIISDQSDRAYGLEQEYALNMGMSVEHKMKWGLRPATFLVDFFRTSFMNEVVFDRENDDFARFYNMKNGTIANSFQAQLDYEPRKRTEIRMAYRLFDVSTQYTIGRMAKPFVARHRGFLNITQSTRSNWQFSSTLQAYGTQRTPGFDVPTGGGVVSKDRYSPSFFQLGAQVSKKITSSFEGYIGAENVLNYKQENPIVNAENPFDKGFDASLVWGPVFGRMIYGGLRWRISDH